jgi:uroporphyrinogen-III synthase
MAKSVRTITKTVENTLVVPKTILITQPKPENDKSPYFDLAKKYGFVPTFHSFVRVEGIDAKEFRKQKVAIENFSAVIFISRNAVDHFFRICEEMKLKVSQEMKYFCISEAVALYLQKFILYRKRKVFFSADGSNDGLLEILTKHKADQQFIMPCSEGSKNELGQGMLKQKIDFVEVTLFRTISNEIKEVVKKNFDCILFFSPISIQALKEQMPTYKQKNTLFGAFGIVTSKAIEEAKFRVDIMAPSANAPSMAAALENYLVASLKKSKKK